MNKKKTTHRSIVVKLKDARDKNRCLNSLRQFLIKLGLKLSYYLAIQPLTFTQEK